MLRSLAVVLLCSSLALTACSDDSATAVDPDGEVVLQPGDGCGDAFFWATNADDTIAVTVTVEQRERSATAPTTVSYDVGDAGLQVRVLRGEGLSSTFCTDVLEGDPVKSDEEASAGHVEVDLDPQVTGFGACGSTHGSATVTGLEGDGLSFADVTIDSAAIGCYAG